jgi:hypothetical protein
LTVAANHFLGIDPVLELVAAVAIGFMSIALVGLAAGLGARYPRFNAENPSQVAGSYGGIAFMIVAVLFVLLLIALLGWPSSVYLLHRSAGMPLGIGDRLLMGVCFLSAAALSIVTWQIGMRSGVRALEAMGK